jgi:2-polyprenyl-3-methyl-5-hydroxy-6-metoxy-1,4-benzoquinol methylase
MKNKNTHGYNERLFSSGFRGKLHWARFKWFAEEVRRLNISSGSILEIGCFDGKIIETIDPQPIRYVGFDANWEGGLDIARTKWKANPQFHFFEASKIGQIKLESSDRFDIAVAMETLEHIPPEEIDAYLELIAKHLNGYLFISVPNEKGLLFLLKWLFKRFCSDDYDRYTISEIICAVLGRCDRIKRKEHKGFDYDLLIKQVGEKFDIVKVSGHPFSCLHHALCFGIGIVAKSK